MLIFSVIFQFEKVFQILAVNRISPISCFSDFTDENTRKLTANFAFCGHADVINIRKTLAVSLQRAQITKVQC